MSNSRIEVTHHLPSEALAMVQDHHSSLRKLVLGGYDLKPEALDDPQAAVDREYNFDDDRVDVFIARDGDEAVGSLTLIKWKDNSTDKRGAKFWPLLRLLNYPMFTKAALINPLACDVGGIVTLPERRGAGIGKKLYGKALEVVNPTILVGQTKTVGAVMVRSRLAGFRSFYGDTEVTFDHPQEYTTDHEALLKACTAARDKVQFLPEGNVFMYHGGIAPTIPDTKGYPPIIATAFRPVIKAQERLIELGITVMSPILSVREEVLR